MTDPDHPSDRPIDLAIPARALAIGAHPDDIEFGCGGTLAKWAASGTEVHLLVLTDGSKGTWDPNVDPAALVATREQEQQAAAAILGATRLHLLSIVDGELQNDGDTRRRISSVIRSVRPDVVLGHDPWKRYRLHPDHRRAGDATIESIVAARDPHFFPDVGVPHRPTSLLLFEAEVLDHVEDISDQIDAKVGALLAHRSQWRSTMGIDDGSEDSAAQHAAFVERVVAVARDAAVGTPCAAAEGFKRISDL